MWTVKATSMLRIYVMSEGNALQIQLLQLACDNPLNGGGPAAASDGTIAPPTQKKIAAVKPVSYAKYLRAFIKKKVTDCKPTVMYDSTGTELTVSAYSCALFTGKREGPFF